MITSNRLLQVLAFLFPFLCFWIPYSLPILLVVINGTLAWHLKRSYLTPVLKKHFIFLPLLAFAYLGLNLFWSLSVSDTLRTLFTLFSIVVLGFLGTNAMMQLDSSYARLLKHRLHQGALWACGSMALELISFGIIFKNHGLIYEMVHLKKHQISYYNQGITLIVIFFGIFFHNHLASWKTWCIYATLLIASLFFDYDAGVLCLWLIPCVFVLFSYHQKAIIKGVTACMVAVIILGPLIPEYILNYDTWRQHFSEQNDPSWLHRLKIWSYVTKKIEKKPFIGWGLNSSRNKIFQEIDTWVVPDTAGKTEGLIKKTPSISLHPHNMTLQIWLEIGLCGALMMTFIISCIGCLLWRNTFSKEAKRTLASVFSITFLFAHLSYGFWQSWWFASLCFIFIWGTLLRTQESTRI